MKTPQLSLVKPQSPQSLIPAGYASHFSHLIDTQHDDTKSHNSIRTQFAIPYDNNKFRINFDAVQTDLGNEQASITVTPSAVDNENQQGLFWGGIFHRGPVYLDFITRLAQNTRMPISIIDTSGVGASKTQGSSVTYDDLIFDAHFAIENMLIKNPKAQLHLMGHSLGTVGLKHFLTHSLWKDPRIQSLQLFAPYPTLKEKFTYLGVVFQALSAWSMIAGKNHMFPTENLVKWCFASLQSNYAQEELLAQIQDERFDMNFPEFATMMNEMLKESPLNREDILNDPRLHLIFGDRDNVMVPRHALRNNANPNIHLLRNRDHGFVAGTNVAEDVIHLVAQNMKKGKK